MRCATIAAMKLNTKKIERERKRLRLTMRQIAKKINLTPAAYSILIKVGSTKITTINRIGKVLGVDPKDLLI